MKFDANAITESLTPLDLEARMIWLGSHYGSKAAFSSSLGIEDQVISHVIFTQSLSLRVFTIDTGRLFEETQSLLSMTRERYGSHIEVWTPESSLLQHLLSEQGPNLFFQSVESRLECCKVRKVEPLQRALKNADVWITGLRRSQSQNRSALPVAEWDQDHKVVKVNPLFDWGHQELMDYVAAHNVPINRLHSKGYPSIGCAPCTRAVVEGEDPRSGRWWWENPNKKECGLHLHTGDKG